MKELEEGCECKKWKYWEVEERGRIERRKGLKDVRRNGVREAQKWRGCKIWKRELLG